MYKIQFSYLILALRRYLAGPFLSGHNPFWDFGEKSEIKATIMTKPRLPLHGRKTLVDKFRLVCASCLSESLRICENFRFITDN